MFLDSAQRYLAVLSSTDCVRVIAVHIFLPMCLHLYTVLFFVFLWLLFLWSVLIIFAWSFDTFTLFAATKCSSDNLSSKLDFGLIYLSLSITAFLFNMISRLCYGYWCFEIISFCQFPVIFLPLADEIWSFFDNTNISFTRNLNYMPSS